MTCALRTNTGLYYTGRAGREWLSPDAAYAFTYTREGAERKAAIFNEQNGPLCGLTFTVVEQQGTGEWT
jgi:hypothetical protein